MPAGIKRTQQRLLRILNIAPPLKEILLSSAPLDEKKIRIRRFLTLQLEATFEDYPDIPPLEWILARDAIRVFRSILSSRSERIAEFSLIEYINNLLHMKNLRDLEMPSSGFFAELDHVLKGIMGKTEVYKQTLPAFVRYRGTKAAKLRSADLSRMARDAEKFMARYPYGLDKKVIQRRKKNISRILKHFKGSEGDWKNWKWHTRHIIRDAETLGRLIKVTKEEREAIDLARRYKIPFGITPYYVSLMDYDSTRVNDYAVRAQVIPTHNYVKKLVVFKDSQEHSMDFMLEQDTSPIEGITRRYPKIVILKPVLTCPQICVYCQRNWEIEDVYSPSANLSKSKFEKALQWIDKTKEISEVLITGGDPFLLSNERLEQMLARLSSMKHVERIRLGTRTLVTLPQRITDSIVKGIVRYHVPGRREILIMTHFEHPYEMTPFAMEAVQKFRRSGIEVYNQLVYTFYNSKKFEAAALRNHLRMIGVTSYYTFNTKGKEETDDYRVPIPRLLQEQKEEARLMPGTVRTDEIVFNVPRLGKNYLRAFQHRDVISLLPNGCRVYEFHPWEKKLSLADTYIYTDVPVYEYLKRLKAAGEELSDYKTIWYYY